MTKEHKVIIGPGLDGRTNNIEWLTKNWPEKHGLQPIVIPITWKDGEPFEPKLRRIVDLIDQFAENGDLISLVGCSAGGSAMLNAFVERKDVVHRAVNNGGFLRPGNRQGFRSFEKRGAASLAFRESVFRFAELEPTLTQDDRKKILTVRPMFDELVPPETVVIQGALNCRAPIIEHILGLTTALIKYDPIIMFLKGEKE